MIKKIAILFSILFSLFAWTESEITPEDLPPWLKPELLVHIASMNMNEDQNNEFREAFDFTRCAKKKMVENLFHPGQVWISADRGSQIEAVGGWGKAREGQIRSN